MAASADSPSRQHTPSTATRQLAAAAAPVADHGAEFADAASAGTDEHARAPREGDEYAASSAIMHAARSQASAAAARTSTTTRLRHALLPEQLLFAAEMVADCSLAAVLLCAHSRSWGALILSFVGVQYLTTWSLVLLFLRSPAGRRRATRTPLARCTLDGGPFGVLALDVLLLLEALGHSSVFDAESGALAELAPAFSASRLVVGAALQSLPVLLLQLALSWRTCAARVATGWRSCSAAGADAHAALVVGSMVLSACSVCVHAHRVRRGAARAQLGLLPYLGTVLNLGGVPLHALHSGALLSYTLGFSPEPREMRALCAALAGDRSLEALNLSGRALADADVLEFAPLLGERASMRLLWLGRNRIGNRGASAIAAQLAQNGSLLELRLWDNRIGDRGVCALADALRENVTLRTLILFGNRVRDVGAEALAEMLMANGTLRTLGLSVNQISDRGATALAHALTVNQVLAELTLAYNRVSDEGGAALIVSFAVNATLAELSLWCAARTGAGRRRAARARPGQRRGTTRYTRRMASTSSASIALRARARALRRPPNITPPAFCCLARACVRAQGQPALGGVRRAHSGRVVGQRADARPPKRMTQDSLADKPGVPSWFFDLPRRDAIVDLGVDAQQRRASRRLCQPATQPEAESGAVRAALIRFFRRDARIIRSVIRPSTP